MNNLASPRRPYEITQKHKRSMLPGENGVCVCDVLAVLRPLVNQLATERLVYFLRSFLSQQNHGEQFCLAGKITCVPRPTNIQYRFDLLMALQVIYLNIPLDPVNAT